MTARKQVFVLVDRLGIPVDIFASALDALEQCAKLAGKPRVKGQHRRIYQVRTFDIRPIARDRRVSASAGYLSAVSAIHNRAAAKKAWVTRRANKKKAK